MVMNFVQITKRKVTEDQTNSYSLWIPTICYHKSRYISRDKFIFYRGYLERHTMHTFLILKTP